jgi:tRNA threonylcarbamoyl adenosine modification protein YjeE
MLSLTMTDVDEGCLEQLALRLVEALPPQAFVALEGDLGAGKTTLVKHIAAAAGIDPVEIVSPTFGLIHEHHGPRGRLIHADMYRLSDPAELGETGWDDAVAEPGWVFVEWPQRIANALPADRLDLSIRIVTPMTRTLVFTARGPRHAAVVAALVGKP